jgi:type I restriction enzyme M protein
MIEPYKGRIYDPCCGSGGMFVQSENFVDEHKGKLTDLAIYGQEANPTTWKLCRMNLAIRGLDGNLGTNHADSFHDDLHKNMRADYILANPPFNISDWGGDILTEDARWDYGTPPTGNANYAWLQHIAHHLSPKGIAGVVLANGSLSSNTSNEGVIRKNMLKEGLVDAIVAMPDKLFYSTGIPVSLWILNKDKLENEKNIDRTESVLFIDARELGTMIDRRHRELSDDDIDKIADTYHNWKSKTYEYEDEKGFCKVAEIKEIEEHDFVLTPGRYVGIKEQEDDGVPFDEKMQKLITELYSLFEKSHQLEGEIKNNLGRLSDEF